MSKRRDRASTRNGLLIIDTSRRSVRIKSVHYLGIETSLRHGGEKVLELSSGGLSSWRWWEIGTSRSDGSMSSINSRSGWIDTVLESISSKTFDNLIPGTESVEILEILCKHPSRYLSSRNSCWVGSRSRNRSRRKSRTGICSRRSDTDSAIVGIESFEESIWSTRSDNIGEPRRERTIGCKGSWGCWKNHSESIDESYEERRDSEEEKEFERDTPGSCYFFDYLSCMFCFHRK